MKSALFFISISFFYISCDMNGLSHHGNGNVVSEMRIVENFHSIQSAGSIDVEIIPSESISVEVENDENLLEYVVAKVENGILYVKYKEGSYSNDHAKVYVRVPQLNEIVSSGSADFDINGTLKNAVELKIRLSGSGDVEGDIDAPSVKAYSSGSGDIKLSGRTQTFECEIRGSGDVECGNLKSEHTIVSVKGSSDVEVFASVSLKVSVAGSGSVSYRGNPTNPEIKISGSGSVRKM
ncbi:MAG: head GIN domain-containing protein [Ginsengibacter sp.]